MSGQALVLDEATRPKAPEIEGVTPKQRRHGQRLALIHRLHLQQIAQVEAVMRAIDAGEAHPARAGEAMTGLQMGANYRLFGNLCGQECQFLTFHHTSEDEQIFPALMRGSEGLRKVVQRLAEEHGVIHALLERLEAEAITLLKEPEEENYRRLKETFAKLAATVRSHFGYEQSELEEAIGYYGIAM